MPVSKLYHRTGKTRCLAGTGMMALLVMLLSSPSCSAGTKGAAGSSVPACKGSELSVTIPGPSPKTGAGLMTGGVFSLWASNDGAKCTIKGYPVISAMFSATGKKVTFAQLNRTKTAAGGPYTNQALVLKHGATAASLIAYGEGEVESNCAASIDVRAMAGTTAKRLAIPKRLVICPASYPSHQLQVTPYHPASVGPFSHWP